MEHLVMYLTAPLASWGEPAVGEFRPTASWPGESALLGLLGAALGIERDDAKMQTALQQSFRFAVGVLSEGDLLRDYHTAQAPSRSDMKGRPHRTRRDELSISKQDLNTILSTRDYRQNGAWLVAVVKAAGAFWSLQQMTEALIRPRFVLYLGRKSCPLAAPLAPKCLEVANVQDAFNQYLTDMQGTTRLTRIVWGEGVDAGVVADITVPRKDRVIARKGWKFGDHMEHSCLLGD